MSKNNIVRYSVGNTTYFINLDRAQVSQRKDKAVIIFTNSAVEDTLYFDELTQDLDEYLNNLPKEDDPLLEDDDWENWCVVDESGRISGS